MAMSKEDLLVAERYARALFEVSCLTHEDVEIEQELEALCTAIERTPEIEKLLANPAFGVDEKKKFLEKIYSERNRPIYETLVNFFCVLFESRRFALIREITRSFKKIADAARGVGPARIWSAVPLDAASESKIVTRLEKIAGYKIIVEKIVDPALVGGIKVKIRNKVLDGSLKNKIELMKKELMATRSV
jgi:F-type H+-transporting ATPase subunit delta